MRDSEYNSIKKKTEITLPLAKEKLIWDLLENKVNEEDQNDLYTIINCPSSTMINIGVSLFHIGFKENILLKANNHLCKYIKNTSDKIKLTFPSFDLLEV